MKLFSYLKDHLPSIILYLFSYFIIFLMLVAFNVPVSLIVAISLVFFLLGTSLIFLGFYRKKVFYNQFLLNLERLDKKYLVLETIPKPLFYEGEILYDALYEINKSMNEYVKYYESQMNDFKEYIEMWIHEVKLPLSTMTLRIHHKKELKDQVIQRQIQLLDQDVEQVLYYVRSEYAEQDYLIKECFLNEIVKSVLLKNKDIFLEKNMELRVEGIKDTVLTDAKWLEFILGQVISNSIKYIKNTGTPLVKITSTASSQEIKLHIYDNGIGIKNTDLKKVFQKSFTGINGHQNQNSTGMGLYIAKKLCQKLGHKIEINSVFGEYTEVTITFFQNHYYEVVK